MNQQIKFARLGVMLDCSRNAVMKPSAVKKYIDIISNLGYNYLMLYTEDIYEIDEHPYFGHNRGRYTQAELKDIDGYARAHGIELIPCIQTLAHLGSIFRWNCYKPIHDCDDILLVGEEKTYDLIDAMFRTISKCFTAKTVNIGMDEAHMLGRGRYQDLNGYINRFDILLNHLNRVSEIAKKYGFELLMWGDMFFRLLNQTSDGEYEGSGESIPDRIKSMIPDNVNLIYWDYYSLDKENYNRKIQSHSAIKENIWFAGGLWTWIGFTPHNDYSIKATRTAFSACHDNGVKDVILTVWGDDGGECSRFSVLPSLFYASELAKGNYDTEKIKSKFYKKFAVSFDDFMLLDLPNTPNDNPDVVSPDKYFFYQDCFMGLFDNLITSEFSERYKKAAERLEAVMDKGEYGILFETQAKLCRVLETKINLGIKTRTIYKSGDKSKIPDLIQEYEKTVCLIEEFYTVYEKRWNWENKPHGFDVQDIRIGGLLMRLKHQKQRLLEFSNDEISHIDELEGPLLDVLCRSNEDNSQINYCFWKNISTTNVF